MRGRLGSERVVGAPAASAAVDCREHVFVLLRRADKTQVFPKQFPQRDPASIPSMPNSANSLVETMNLALEQMIPRAHQMGIRFVELRPGYVRAELPFEGNGNHFGTVYAGVIFTLAEVLGGAMHFASFDVSTHYPLVRGMTIEFLAPGRGALSASAALSDAELEAVRGQAADGGKAPFALAAEVVAENGALVARTRGDYQIRPYGS